MQTRAIWGKTREQIISINLSTAERIFANRLKSFSSEMQNTTTGRIWHKRMHPFVCVWSSSSFSNKEMWKGKSWHHQFQRNKHGSTSKICSACNSYQQGKEGNHNEKHLQIVCVPVRYVRREHLRLFLSFFLLLSPALEGDSSLSLAWLDILEELCWLKWLGTWRANPPWEAKLALQPPTTHCSGAQTRSTFGIFAT